MKRGFSLSEVLIVLGVIGVIASLTLPSVIKNYQKQATVNKLKKVYTILNQAITLSQTENGEYKYFDDASAIGINQYFDKYWKPYLKIMKICNTYRECGYSSKTPWRSNDNNEQAPTVLISADKRLPVILQDGSLILFNNTNSAFYVDLNSGLPPNIFGKDVFIFSRSLNGHIYPCGYGNSPEIIKINCSNTVRNYCATKIMNDGWKIEKDYPW